MLDEIIPVLNAYYSDQGYAINGCSRNVHTHKVQ